MFRVPVFWLPLADLAPTQSPEAVQEVGLLVALQVRVELPPVVIEIGLAASDTTGAAGIVTCTAMLLAKPVPPALVQDRLYRYVLAVFNVPVLALPLAALAPAQPPEAVQVVGLLVTLQVRVAALPTNIEPGLADSDTTGVLGNTWITAVSMVLPVLLAQVMVYEYDLIMLRVPMACEPPPVALAPVQSPDAVQELGVLVTAQVSVTGVPGVKGPTGLLESETIGRYGGGVAAATVAVA